MAKFYIFCLYLISALISAKESDAASNCFDHLEDSAIFTEVVGDKCIDEISGKNGRYRWTKQCNFPYSYDAQPIPLYNCCVPVVCCPDVEINLIHEQKCAKYSSAAYPSKWEMKGPYTLEASDDCRSGILVFGGTKALTQEFPFMAALGFKKSNGEYEWGCGGTLISEQYILTAGHCLFSKDFGSVEKIRLGTISLNGNSTANNISRDYTIIERIPHPKYTRKSFYNDIALLRLNETIKFNSHIRPACLANSFEITEEVTAMGWGLTDYLGSNSEDLLQVRLEIFPHANCNKTYFVNRKLSLGVVDETQLCAGSNDSKRDTCPGDSGGPLVSKHVHYNYMHKVAGITSIGIACGSVGNGTPGIYTRIYPFISWIESVVWPHKKEPMPFQIINYDNDDHGNRIGDSCIDKSTGNAGVCELVTLCTEVFDKIKNGHRNHTVCGYQNLLQIVCCSPKKGSVTNFGRSLTNKCYEPLNDSKYVEVVGETCADEISGNFGKYRWLSQCPFHGKTKRKIFYSCCIPIVCCPDIDTNPPIIHEQKCVDYSRTVFEGKFEIEGPYTQEADVGCPTFFSGGTEVSKKEFPFMAALGFERLDGGFEWNCGATLISNEFVLTAAHCLKSNELGPVMTVRLGAISLNESSANNNHQYRDYKITERISHPNYTKRSFYNDIALLRLNKPVDFNTFIRPACLPSSTEISETITAMGWGATEYSGDHSNNLLKGDLEIFSYEQCNDNYNINRKLLLGIVDASQVCAGSKNSNKDTCQGDSGGPLVSRNEFQYMVHDLVGITSIGKACGTPGTPGVYTRVFPYIEWIQSIVWP